MHTDVWHPSLSGIGWLYLAVVVDLCSRKAMGWSMSTHMKAQLVCDAMETWQRRSKAGLIHHSDRGSQHASRDFRQLLKKHGFKVAILNVSIKCRHLKRLLHLELLASKAVLRRKGNCRDNAVTENFFGSLKQEQVQVQWKSGLTRDEAQQDVPVPMIMRGSWPRRKK